MPFDGKAEPSNGGKDPAALRSFYREIFDWEIGPPMPPEAGNYAIVSGVGERGIGGGIGGGTEGYDGHVTFYVAVDELEAALKKAQSLGGNGMGEGPVVGAVEITRGRVERRFQRQALP